MSRCWIKLLQAVVLFGVVLGPVLCNGQENTSDSLTYRGPRFEAASRGDLAIRSASAQAWHVVPHGELLPQTADLRTSAAGTCWLSLDEATVQLAAEATGRLAGSKVELRSGSLILVTQKRTETATGAVQMGAVWLEPSANAIVECEIAGEAAIVRVAHGKVTLHGRAEPVAIVGERQSVTWKLADPMPMFADAAKAPRLTPEEVKRIEEASVQPQAQGVGQLLVQDSQADSPVRLNLAHYHVNVVLQPPVALVQIDQSFFNPYHRQQEGTFLFNLPEGSSVSRFAMFTTPTTLIEGELIERKQAAGIYQSIVNARRDPAILEQLGSNLFRMRVFPIFARDTKRILLDYTLPLEEQPDGGYSFQLPLMSDLEPIWDFRIRGTIRGESIEAATSVSHPEIPFIKQPDGAVRFDFHEAKHKPEGALVVRFRLPPTQQIAVRSHTSPAVKELSGKITPASTYFLATLPAEQLSKAHQGEPAEVANNDAPSVESAQAPLDLLILADTSAGFRQRERMERAVQTILHTLRPTDRYQLGCVDVSYRPLSKGWQTPEAATTAASLVMLRDQLLLGVTDLSPSLRGALSSLPAPVAGRRRLVIYVGDGRLPDSLTQLGMTMDFNSIEQLVLPAFAAAQARACAVLLEDDDRGRGLFHRLAQASGGRVFELAGHSGFGEFYDWLLSSCPSPLTKLSVSAPGIESNDLFVDQVWTPGEPLHLYGKCATAGEIPVRLEYERAGRKYSLTQVLQVNAKGEDVFVGRLWGQQKLDQLRLEASPFSNRESDRPQLEAQLVALSQEWTLLSPATAFLVLETEDEYAKYNIVRQRRQKYWTPTDAHATPLPADLLKIGVPAPFRRSKLGNEIPPEQFEAILAQARQKLEELDGESALVILGSVFYRGNARSPEYQRLFELAEVIAARQEFTHTLGALGPLFNRNGKAGFGQSLFVPPADQLELWLAAKAPSLQGELSPIDQAMLKKVTPPKESMLFVDILNWIGKESGQNYHINHRLLEDDGIDLTTPYTIEGIRSMSLRNVARHVLSELQMTWWNNDGVIEFTTMLKAGEELSRQTYPVGDLLHPGVPTPTRLLANPDLDFRIAATKRLEGRLEQRMTLDVKNAPLKGVLTEIASKIDDNFLIARKVLEDDGVDLSSPVSVTLKDVPIRTVLKHLLSQVQCTSIIRDEAVVITTHLRSEEELETRAYSGVGLLFLGYPTLDSRRAWLATFRDRGHFGGGGSGGSFGGGGSGFGGGGGGGSFGGPPGGGDSNEVTRSNSGAKAVGIPEPEGNPPAAAAPEPPPEVPTPDELALPNAVPPDAGLASQPPPEIIPEPRPDATTLIDIVLSTVEPESWDEFGGPGSIRFLPDLLSFSVRATARQHAEVERLFDDLRSTPPARPGTQAHVRLAGFGSPEELIAAITDTIEPESWDEVGGPGSIRATEDVRSTLMIRQTDAIHVQIRDLLTQLRRAKVEALSGRVWKLFGEGGRHRLVGINGLTALPVHTLSNLAAAQPDEIEALKFRRRPFTGAMTWRATRENRPADLTTVRTSGARQDLEFDGRTARLEGDNSAVGYPGLLFVEFGDWGETLRQIVDGRLPWLPHRTNEDLAQQFHVTKTRDTADTVTLRLGVPNAPADVFLQIALSKAHGLPTQWEAWQYGDLKVKLRFENLTQIDGEPRNEPQWKTVIAESGTGQVLERWELVSASPLKSGLAPLNEWPGYLPWDDRQRDQILQTPHGRALAAVRAEAWDVAQQQFEAALREHPDHPFLQYLEAWTLQLQLTEAPARRSPGVNADEGQPRVGGLGENDTAAKDRILALLTAVIQRGPVDLAQAVNPHSFSTLGPQTLYNLLDQRPPALRTVRDWERLADASGQLSQLDAAVTQMLKAIEFADKSPEASGRLTPFERERRLAGWLLELQRAPEALARINALVSRQTTPPEQIALMAELLKKYNLPGDSKRLVDLALAHPLAKGARRAPLLVLRAAVEVGQPRWRALLEAVALADPRSHERRETQEQLVRELGVAQVHLVGVLADETTDKPLRSRLLLHQINLYDQLRNTKAAAETAWRLHEIGSIETARSDWLCFHLHAAGDYERLVRLLESRIRAIGKLERIEYDWLTTAYGKVGRVNDANRARSSLSDGL